MCGARGGEAHRAEANARHQARAIFGAVRTCVCKRAENAAKARKNADFRKIGGSTHKAIRVGTNA